MLTEYHFRCFWYQHCQDILGDNWRHLSTISTLAATRWILTESLCFSSTKTVRTHFFLVLFRGSLFAQLDAGCDWLNVGCVSSHSWYEYGQNTGNGRQLAHLWWPGRKLHSLWSTLHFRFVYAPCSRVLIAHQLWWESSEYLGSITTDEGSKPEILSRIA